MIELTWEWLVVIISASASVGAFINHFREIYAALKKPREEMKNSISDIRGALNEHISDSSVTQKENERRFKNDLEELKVLRTESRMNLKAQLTVISALIDGNHNDELKERREEIQTYLIEKP